MIVIDTTVLVYAVGASHPLRDPCRKLVREAADGGLRLTTTVEVIQEFAHVRARRRTREDAAELVDRWIDLVQPLLLPDVEDLRVGLDLFVATPALGCFDAVLAAICRRRGASALVSADRAFAGVDEVGWLDPASPELIARVREAGGYGP